MLAPKNANAYKYFMQIVWEYESGVQTETAKQNNTLNNYSHNNNRKKSEMKKRRRTKKCKSTYTLVPKAKQIRGIWRGVAICASNRRDGQAKRTGQLFTTTTFGSGYATAVFSVFPLFIYVFCLCYYCTLPIILLPILPIFMDYLRHLLLFCCVWTLFAFHFVLLLPRF